MRRLITGLAVVGAAFVSAAPTASADPTLQTYTFPAGVKSAEGIAAAPDGTVYVGTDDNTKTPPIAKVDPAQVSPGTANGVTLIASPANPDPAACCVRLFRDLTFSPVSNTLFWTRSDAQVGMLGTGGMSSITIGSKTGGYIEPFGIVAAPDGGAWFTEKSGSNVSPTYNGNRIAYVSSSLGGPNEQVNLALQGGRTTLDSLRYVAQPKGITMGLDGKPWFVSSDPGNPGWYIGTTKGTEYEEYRLCPCGSVAGSPSLTDVVAAKDGMLWYTNEQKNAFGRFDPVTHDYEDFALATLGLSAGRPVALAAGGDGSVWLAVSGFAQPTANAIVKIVPAVTGPPQATIYRIGTAIAPTSIATDTKGNVWFSGTSFGGPGGFGRLGDAVATDPGTGGGGGEQPPAVTTTPPATSTPPATTVTLTPSTSARATVNDPTVKGDSVSANQICVGPPQDKCSLVYLIQTHEYVTGFPGSKGLMAAKPKKLTTIGQLKVTLKGGQSKKVTVKLNAKGKKLRKKRSFKATLTVTQAVNGAKPKQILKKSLKFKR